MYYQFVWHFINSIITILRIGIQVTKGAEHGHNAEWPTGYKHPVCPELQSPSIREEMEEHQLIPCKIGGLLSRGHDEILCIYLFFQPAEKIYYPPSIQIPLLVMNLNSLCNLPAIRETKSRGGDLVNIQRLSTCYVPGTVLSTGIQIPLWSLHHSRSSPCFHKKCLLDSVRNLFKTIFLFWETGKIKKKRLFLFCPVSS